MRKLLFALILVLYTFVVCAQTQSEFQKPVFWLKASNINDSLSVIPDISGNENHALLPEQFLYTQDMMNFNPCIQIDDIQGAINVDYTPEKSAEITVFAVYKPTASKDPYGIWSMSLDSANAVSLSTQHLEDLNNEFTYADTTLDIPLINLFRYKWSNQSVDTSGSTFNIFELDSLTYEGKFAELLFFDKPVVHTDIKKIHTYLAIKYGISIETVDYVNSEDSVLWNYSENEYFSNEIAGIGKDTILGINQKQGCAFAGESILTFSVGQTHEYNDSNTTQLNNMDFLIWSDNGNSMTFVTPDTLDPMFHSAVSGRRWLMFRSGATAMNINTNLKIHSPGLNDSTFLTLLISRTSNFDFPIDSTLMVFPDSVDADGYYYFSNVNWDIDSSGSDAFAFQNLNIADLEEMNNTNSTNEDNDNLCDFINSDDFADFFNDNNQSNSDENELLSPSQNQKVLSSVSIYPNPTKGDFVVEANLNEASEITMKIFDESAKLIDSKSFDNNDSYIINSYLRLDGCYFIVVETKGESKTIKLIVQ